MIMLTVQLLSGIEFETPFSMLKKDRPLDLAKYIIKEVVESKRGGKYELWSKKCIKKNHSYNMEITKTYSD